MKRQIRLTESDLHNIIKQSMNRILKENKTSDISNNNWELYEELKENGLEDEVLGRLVSQVGDMAFGTILNEIKQLYLETDEDEPVDMSSHYDEQGYYDDDWD